MNFDQHILSPTPLIKLENSLFKENKIEVWVKRDDLSHPAISGNKYRKLKYNLIQAKKQGKNTLVTFGGAYSNHIYALSAAAKLFGFKSIGIIRGDELNPSSSPTLRFAAAKNMELRFVTRSAYRDKPAIVKSFSKEHYIIAEGGSNTAALKGCSEMLDEVLNEVRPTHFCLAAGTGGTTAGITINEKFKGLVYAFPVLKNGGFIMDEVNSLLGYAPNNLKLFTDYHFGGYAKTKPELIEFIKSFEENYGFELDQVYTAKLCYGVLDLIEKGHFNPGSKIVIYHSGGLQGKLTMKKN